MSQILAIYLVKKFILIFNMLKYREITNEQIKFFIQFYNLYQMNKQTIMIIEWGFYQ